MVSLAITIDVNSPNAEVLTLRLLCSDSHICTLSSMNTIMVLFQLLAFCFTSLLYSHFRNDNISLLSAVVIFVSSVNMSLKHDVSTFPLCLDGFL